MAPRMISAVTGSTRAFAALAMCGGYTAAAVSGKTAGWPERSGSA